MKKKKKQKKSVKGIQAKLVPEKREDNIVRMRIKEAERAMDEEKNKAEIDQMLKRSGMTGPLELED